MTNPINLQFAARTDKGISRQLNEDNYYASKKHNLFVVADGMGGHNAGEIASQIVVTVFQEWANGFTENVKLNDTERLTVLRQLIGEANWRIFSLSQEGIQHTGMGTTLTAFFLTPEQLIYAHIGDSRIYILRNNILYQMTKDHSLVQLLVDAGDLTPENARTHPKRNVIHRAVGTEPTVQMDGGFYPIEAGDIVLACTDGLHDMVVADTEIAELISSASDLDVVCCNLIDRALHYGGRDNVTLILARYTKL